MISLTFLSNRTPAHFHVLHRYSVNELRSTHELIHHLLELHECDESIAVLVGLFDDLLPDVLIAELLSSLSKHLFDLFGRYLAIAVLVEMLEGLSKPIFLKNLLLVHAGNLPLAEINAAVSVQVRPCKGTIYLFLQVTLLKVAVDLLEAIEKFFFSDLSV